MKKKILAFLVTVSLIVSFPIPIQTVAYAATVTEEDTLEDDIPVYDTDVSSASEGCVIVGVQGEYVMDVQAALDRINEIRLEACNEGMPNPSKPSENLTASDYKPIKWSGDLEYIARIRAVEAIIVKSHTRPNGSSCFTLKSPNNKQSYGEVLAWNWTKNILYGINQWYDEKSDWEAQNSSAVTGHYTAMINPSNTYVGLGCFISDAGYYPNCTSGEFSSASSLSETPMDNLGKCIQKIEIDKTNFDSGSLSGTNTLDIDETSKLSLTTTYTSGTTKSKLFVTSDINWQSDNPLVAGVSEDGVVTGLSEGTATISAQSEDGFSGTLSITVSHDWQAATYTWNADNTKCVAERVCKNNASHKETADANITSVGTATCEEDGTITYTASFDKAWAKAQLKTEKLVATGHTIEVIAGKPATLTTDGLTEGKKCSVCGKLLETQKPIYKVSTVRLSQTKYVYDGKVKAPTLIVKDSKGNIISSKDYTVSTNSKAKNVGKYTYKVTFKGNYAGNKTFTFKINPKPTSVSKVTAKSKSLNITLKKQKTQTSGYEIELSANSKFTKSVKRYDIKKNTTVTKTIKKLKAKTKYYVRVRTYKLVNGEKIYSSWTKYKKAVTTKK